MTYLVDQKVVYFSVPALGWHCYKEKVPDYISSLLALLAFTWFYGVAPEYYRPMLLVPPPIWQVGLASWNAFWTYITTQVFLRMSLAAFGLVDFEDAVWPGHQLCEDGIQRKIAGYVPWWIKDGHMTWAQMYGKEPVDSDTEEETDNGTYDEKEGADMADTANSGRAKGAAQKKTD